MNSAITIADILNRKDRPKSIRFDNVDSLTSHCDRVENSILGFYEMTEFSAGTCDDKHYKAFDKHKRAALTIAQLFNGKPQPNPGDREIWNVIDMEPFMAVRDTFIMDAASSEGHVREMDSRNLFQTMEFHFPNSPPDSIPRSLSSIQHLHFSYPSLKANEPLFSKHGIPAVDHIEIVSGICLFNANVVESSLSEGGRINPGKLQQAKPTLYEMEYIARSSSAIADIASVLISKSKSEQRFRPHVNITLDIPSFHYYHTVVGKFEQGLCCASEAMNWMEAIDLRHDQIAHVFSCSVRHELHRRGVDYVNCKINVSSRTNSVACSVRQAIRESNLPSLDEVLQKISSEDGAWREFYEFVPLKERPENFEDLGYLFYVFQVVKSAFQKSPTRLEQRPTLRKPSNGNDQPRPWSSNEARSNPRSLVVSIDDSAERRIYSRAQKVLKSIRQLPGCWMSPTLVEMYMCGRVFINGNIPRSRLYHEDPVPENPALSFSGGNEFDTNVDTNALVRLEPVDIVRRLYGSDCAWNLQLLFNEVGL
jgi:hypothetical protein